MALDNHLGEAPADAEEGIECAVHRLTKQFATTHTRRLLAIHNSIPHVSWEAQNLLADADGDRQFTDKWQHSAVVIDSARHEPVGLMIAYARPPREVFTEPSLYLHRGAILHGYRGNGIGRMLFEHFTRAPADSTELEWITLQTNATPSNEWVIRFYERLGFERGEYVVYEDKTDYLMYKRRR